MAANGKMRVPQRSLALIWLLFSNLVKKWDTFDLVIFPLLSNKPIRSFLYGPCFTPLAIAMGSQVAFMQAERPAAWSDGTVSPPHELSLKPCIAGAAVTQSQRNVGELFLNFAEIVFELEKEHQRNWFAFSIQTFCGINARAAAVNGRQLKLVAHICPNY